MTSELLKIIPVLPSADVARDVAWYKEQAGFEAWFYDDMYAVIYREHLVIHLQWHAGTESDPLKGGSVIRIAVKEIEPLFNEFVQRGTVDANSFKRGTAWGTNEFGFFDLNENAVFVMEDI